jgi:hypothetical protein
MQITHIFVVAIKFYLRTVHTSHVLVERCSVRVLVPFGIGMVLFGANLITGRIQMLWSEGAELLIICYLSMNLGSDGCRI